MYLCVRGIHLTSFYDFDILFSNCSDDVVFFNFIINILLFNTIYSIDYTKLSNAAFVVQVVYTLLYTRYGIYNPL